MKIAQSLGAAPAELGQITRVTFRSQIADELRRGIIGGALQPGEAVTEQNLAARFGVSRGPLREAMSQLAEEGLLVSIPFTGTRVVNVSLEDVREIYSLRVALESLAFREIWNRRDNRFERILVARHEALLASLSARDHVLTTAAEVALHSTVYECCGHRLLHETWRRIAGRMQLYLAVHQRAHDRKGPLADAHRDYVKLALSSNIDAMLAEIEAHMQRGVRQLEAFVNLTVPVDQRSRCRSAAASALSATRCDRAAICSARPKPE
jgi:DNA-binding GntR family transcriptional regulator